MTPMPGSASRTSGVVRAYGAVASRGGGYADALRDVKENVTVADVSLIGPPLQNQDAVLVWVDHRGLPGLAVVEPEGVIAFSPPTPLLICLRPRFCSSPEQRDACA